MKAVVSTEYGPPEVLRVEEVEKPVPKDNEILIKVRATPVTFGEVMIRDFRVPFSKFWLPGPLWLPTRLVVGWSRPRRYIAGSECAGIIEAVGNKVTRFKAGDEVFAYFGFHFSAAAEYVCIKENGIVTRKPAGVSFEEACVAPFNSLTALHFTRNVARVKPGQKVLVNGATGGIGQFAAQLAKHYGAEVTGVCSTNGLEMLKSIGVDKAVDYTKEDFTKNGEKYDVILDTIGRTTFKSCEESLSEKGKYLLCVFQVKQLFQMLWTWINGGKRVICSLSGEKMEDLEFIRKLMEKGDIKVLIDKAFPLEGAVEAHRRVEAGGKSGNVVLTD